MYPDLVKLAGGPDRVTQLALEKLQAGKPVEALHLTDVVLASDPNNRAALNARLKALDYLREHVRTTSRPAGWIRDQKAKEKLASK